MSDMKCPFCQQELKDQWVGQYVAHEYFDCPRCKMNGNTKLWQALIDTKNQLTVERTTHDILQEELKKLQKELAYTKKKLDIAVAFIKELDDTRSGSRENLHAYNGRTLNAGNGFCWATIDQIHNVQRQINKKEKKNENTRTN